MDLETELSNEFSCLMGTPNLLKKEKKGKDKVLDWKSGSLEVLV